MPFFAKVPEGLTVTTAPIWGEMVKWININFFDYLRGRSAPVLLLYVLNPIKQFLLGVPWLGASSRSLTYAGWRLRDRQILAARLAGVPAAPVPRRGRQWDKAMITVYLCAISASSPA